MRNLQKNLSIVWQPPPFLDNHPHLAYPPFPSILKKVEPPTPFLWFFALHEVTFGDEKYRGIFGNLVMENLDVSWDLVS